MSTEETSVIVEPQPPTKAKLKRDQSLEIGVESGAESDGGTPSEDQLLNTSSHSEDSSSEARQLLPTKPERRAANNTKGNGTNANKGNGTVDTILDMADTRHTNVQLHNNSTDNVALVDINNSVNSQPIENHNPPTLNNSSVPYSATAQVNPLSVTPSSTSNLPQPKDISIVGFKKTKLRLLKSSASDGYEEPSKGSKGIHQGRNSVDVPDIHIRIEDETGGNISPRHRHFSADDADLFKREETPQNNHTNKSETNDTDNTTQPDETVSELSSQTNENADTERPKFYTQTSNKLKPFSSLDVPDPCLPMGGPGRVARRASQPSPVYDKLITSHSTSRLADGRRPSWASENSPRGSRESLNRGELTKLSLKFCFIR